mgnify:CR=1 FL=1
MIGLTGGIASGKSTVSALLQEAGVTLIDADKLYHDLIKPIDGKPSPLAQKIGDAFSKVLLEDGSVNRQALGSRVFGHEEELKKLSAITHPAVGGAFMARVQELQQSGETLAVYDVPLLYERGMEQMLAGVMVVWVPGHLQLARLMSRDKIDERAAQSRLDSQWSLDEKRNMADWVIDNSRTREKTAEQVQIWLKEIRETVDSK